MYSGQEWKLPSECNITTCQFPSGGSLEIEIVTKEEWDAEIEIYDLLQADYTGHDSDIVNTNHPELYYIKKKTDFNDKVLSVIEGAKYNVEEKGVIFEEKDKNDAKQFWTRKKLHGNNTNYFFINLKSKKVLTVLKEKDNNSLVAYPQSQFITPIKVIQLQRVHLLP